MSLKQNDIYIESLLEQYQELSEYWNGKSLVIEQQLQDLASELLELGVDVDKVVDK